MQIVVDSALKPDISQPQSPTEQVTCSNKENEVQYKLHIFTRTIYCQLRNCTQCTFNTQLFCRRHQIVLPQLQQRFDYHTLVLFFKIKSNLAPPYLTELLPQLLSHCGYNFRKNLYPVPAVKKSSTLTSFFPRSIILWNSLPSDIQSSTSLPKFKAVLRAYLKV